MREVFSHRRVSVALLTLTVACAAPLPEDPAQAEAEAVQLLEQAYADLDARRWDEGLDKSQRALRLREHAGAGPTARAEAHAHLAWARAGRGEEGAAAAHESTVARLCEEVAPGTDDLRSYVMHLLGNVHHGRGEPARARRWWEPTLHDLRSAPEPDPESIAWVGNDLADQLRRLGEIDRAESLQVEMVRLARAELGPGPFTAVLLNNLGALYWDQDRLDEAEALYREALEASLASEDASAARRAIAHLNLGVLQHDQARWDVARENLDRALELSREAFAPDDPQRVMFLLERGRLAASTHEGRGGIAWWEEGLGVLTQQPDPPAMYEAYLLQALGEARLDQGEARLAASDFERAVRLREQAFGPDHAEVGESLAGLAAAHLVAGEGERARNASDRALAILANAGVHIEPRALALVTRARLARDAGDSERARTEYGEALALIEELRPRRGGGDQTRARFLEDYVDWYSERISLSIASGQIEDAVLDVERMRARVLRDRLRQGRIDPLSGLSPEAREPLERAERAARSRIGAAQRELAFLRATWTKGDDETARRIGEQEEQRERALRELRDAQARIEAEAARAGHRNPMDPTQLDLDSLLAQSLEQQEIALLYHLGSDRSYVFVLSAAGSAPSAIELSVDPASARALGIDGGPLTPNRLRRALVGLRATNTAPAKNMNRGVVGLTPARPEDAASDPTHSRDDTTKIASRLYALFEVLCPAPVRESLEEFDAVVVIPDGDLHRLPFEMLVVEIGDEADPSPSYWLDAGPVLRYGHSLATLAALGETTSSGRDRDLVVSICDPTFAAPAAGSDSTAHHPGQLRPLPGTRRESDALAALHPATRLRVLSGADATEASLKALAPRARILHLATHGLVDERGDALLASLALSQPAVIPAPQSAEEDGFLNLFEIYDLPLRGCELAVLSACETQVGEQVRGEGVFALSRGFLAAGVRRTVASLWSVNDRSTAELMAAFFADLARAERAGERPDHARALRDAKRLVRSRSEWASPFHWAPFVLSGSR